MRRLRELIDLFMFRHFQKDVYCITLRPEYCTTARTYINQPIDSRVVGLSVWCQGTKFHISISTTQYSISLTLWSLVHPIILKNRLETVSSTAGTSGLVHTRSGISFFVSCTWLSQCLK